MLGFFQADGCLRSYTRNRGTFSIEMHISNKPLLEKISKLIPYNNTIGERIRDTNFKENYHSVFLRVCNLEFRNIINAKGIPYGKKSEVVKPPVGKFSEPDYYRGLIDGDGSIGITKDNLPFISFTTASEELCASYISYIYKHTGCRRVINRNKRDNIYNIMIMREPAQILAKIFYYPGCNLYVDKKINNSSLVAKWKRPKNFSPHNATIKYWEDWEVEFILSHSIEDSMEKLNRSRKSINTKLWRIKKG